MNEKSTKGLAVLMAVAGTLAPELDTTVAIPVETQEKQKERTIRKCADPKKKAKRKMAQASKRRNRM